MEKTNFLTNLYTNFLFSFSKITDWCKDNLVLACCIGGGALLLLILIFAGIVKGVKKRRRRIQAENERIREKMIAAAKPTTATSQTAAKAALKKAEPAKQAPTKAVQAEEAKPTASVEEPAVEAVKIEPVKAELIEEPPVKPTAKTTVKAIDEVAPAKATKAESKKEASPAAKSAPTKKKVAPKSKAEDVEETLAMVEDMQDYDDEIEEGETDRQAKYRGKWTICRVLTDEENADETYFFELRASNGEKLLSSEEYTTYQGALRGIQTHKTNILNGNLKITVSKKGDYIFKLLSGKNMLLCMGENYPSKDRCQRAIDSTVRFAATAVIDENVQDIVIKIPKEDDTPIAPLSDNVVGKWIISAGVNAEEEKIFYFELFANNGEKLLSSEEYTTYIGAVNGIHTHKKNIEKDNFRITLTKRGDYIYKLLNGNGQLLCLGEHYKTKRLCARAVESVKRFALNSPILTDTDQK